MNHTQSQDQFCISKHDFFLNLGTLSHCCTPLQLIFYANGTLIFNKHSWTNLGFANLTLNYESNAFQATALT